jgi:glyoxylase-like metal-dependent hydrolase (beta-lactamase superfamily II)
MREPVVPGIHEIQLQRVKAHAILDDEGVTLIDTGYAGSLSRIERGLAGLGRSVSDVRRVVCTHGHPDHAGSASAFADLGIEVNIHPADAANLDIGISDAVRRPSRGRIFAAMTPPLARFTPLEDGAVLPVLGGLEVIHTPGHTPGSVCLFAPRDGTLFVGDTLQRRFGRVSFASGLYSDDPAMARASVQRLAQLGVSSIVFSHWAPITDGAAEIIASLAERAAATT